MNEKSRAIPRNVLTDFCKALGYDPREVISVDATAETVSVKSMPPGVTGIEGIVTIHEITDAEVQA